MLRTFHRWGGLVFIGYVFPNWRMLRILSIGCDISFLIVVRLIRDIERVVYCELSSFLIGGIQLDPQDELLYRELFCFL